MKKIFQSLFVLTGAAMIIAACAKEIKAPVEELEGELQSVTFTATMDNGTVTRAAADGDGAAASVNRCIMEIYYDGSLFARDIQPVTHGDKITATFTAQVVANRTYTVAFWADHVASTEALGTDLYYTTDAAQPNGGLQAIALKGTYAGNNDARDAFFAVDDYTIAQAGTACEATLKRPFAQINVITTDWDKADKVSNLKPTSVDVTIKNPLTAFNALTGVASTTVSTLTYNADIYTSPTSGTDATLSMDYLFASADKAVIDIDWKAGQGTDASTVSHSFTNIPYQRNYRTNIKGNLLTSQGQWTVTVDPVWGGEHNQIVEVKDIQSANAAIQANASSSTIDVKFSAEPNDSGVPTGESTSTSRAILTTPVAEGATLSIEVATDTKALYVGDYQYDYKVDQTVNANAATVNINVPSSGSIGTLVINAPSKTVYINGKKVSSVGTITNLDAITSDNTLVIEANQTVTNLIVRQGALEIHGTVGAATVTVAEGKHVYVRACEGLSSTVYNVLKPYIDVDNGYKGEQEEGKETYRVYREEVAQIGETKFYTLAAAFAAVKDSETITLIKNCETGASYSETNMLALTVANVTLDLNGKTITETNNFSFVIAGNNDIVKNGNIVSGYNSAKTCEYQSYAMVVGAKTTSGKVTGVQIKNVTFTGGVSIGGSTEGNEADYQGPAEVTIEGCAITSGDWYTICVQPANTTSEVTVLSGTYNHKSSQYSKLFSAETGCTISLKGGTYDANPSAYVAEDYVAVSDGGSPEHWTVQPIGDNVAINTTTGTLYTSLPTAISGAANGQTVKLLQNIDLPSQIDIKGKKSITLDLNGKTITNTNTTSQSSVFYVFMESGNITFTVKDSKGGGKVTPATKQGCIFNVYANSTSYKPVLNIEGGIFDAGEGTQSYVIYMNGKGTEANISGGTFRQAGTQAYLAYTTTGSVMNITGGDFQTDKTMFYGVGAYNISGGTFTGRGNFFQSSWGSNKTHSTISGGTFNHTNETCSNNEAIFSLGCSEQYFDISGGTFTAKKYYHVFWMFSKPDAANKNVITVTGGTFTDNPAEAYRRGGMDSGYPISLVASGYISTAQSTTPETWTVTEDFK